MKERPAAIGSNLEFDALRRAIHYRRALAAEFKSCLRGEVLEVGAGIGQMTELLRRIPEITWLLAVEPDAARCREFQRLLPSQPLIQGTIASLTERRAWNAIVSVNVLEHIEDDETELAHYHSLLRENGGKLCLFAPARQELYAPIDRDFGHYRRYGKAELFRKLTAARFTITRLRYFNCAGYFAWWLNFRLLGKRAFDPTLVTLFDRWIFPFQQAIETRAGWAPVGQSLLAIAEAG